MNECASEVFVQMSRDLTDEKVISKNCPKCGSAAIGYCIPCKEYDCSECGFTWKNRLTEERK